MADRAAAAARHPTAAAAATVGWMGGGGRRFLWRGARALRQERRLGARHREPEGLAAACAAAAGGVCEGHAAPSPLH
jgi:hypothetical protein